LDPLAEILQLLMSLLWDQAPGPHGVL